MSLFKSVASAGAPTMTVDQMNRGYWETYSGKKTALTSEYTRNVAQEKERMSSAGIGVGSETYAKSLSDLEAKHQKGLSDLGGTWEATMLRSYEERVEGEHGAEFEKRAMSIEDMETKYGQLYGAGAVAAPEVVEGEADLKGGAGTTTRPGLAKKPRISGIFGQIGTSNRAVNPWLRGG